MKWYWVPMCLKERIGISELGDANVLFHFDNEFSAFSNYKKRSRVCVAVMR